MFSTRFEKPQFLKDLGNEILQDKQTPNFNSYEHAHDQFNGLMTMNRSSYGEEDDDDGMCRGQPEEDCETAECEPEIGQSPKLLVEPESLEGVASAYRYKLTILNQELFGCAFNFSDELDVFNFNDVNKKRALKKEDWPTDSTLDNPNRYDVRVQLMAGNVEIKTCGGCSMWKDLTRKPFLVLTPHGNRCIQFVRKPFVLLIFRCCPKFHSFAKQFKLVISVCSPFTGAKFTTEVNIYRKKMNSASVATPAPVAAPAVANPNSKKRKSKVPPPDEEEEVEKEEKPTTKKSEVEVSAPPPKTSPFSARFDATVSLHETLFPQQKLLKVPKVEENNRTVDPVAAALAIKQLFPSYGQVLPQDTLKPKSVKAKKGNVPQYEQPFQQYQQEYEQIQQEYMLGQPVPTQVVSPALLYELLYPKPKSAQVPLSFSQPPPKVAPITTPNPNSLSPFWPGDTTSYTDVVPDEKWLDSLLEFEKEASFSSKEGYQSNVVDPIKTEFDSRLINF